MKKTIKKIKLLRLEKEYTQSYMGSLLDISQRTYGKLENGKIKLTVTRLEKISKILAVNITELL